jgi:signal transduction histidine kinase/ligand-binding sensor domain-containing protein/CheY-like chemotaxis protein/AraC-like DNA-binding protein
MYKTRQIFGSFRIPCLRLAFILISLFISKTLYSTIIVVNDSVRIKYFTLEDGLSQVTVNDLLKDNSGFVWIATEHGLNMFDGEKFRHFKHSSSDSMTISGNFTNKLLEDKAGNIWVGTVGNGLNYYDKNLDVFHRFDLKYAQNENETISAIATDESGTIWMTSRYSGLHLLQPLENGSFLQDNYFSNQPLNALLYDKHKNLWVGGFSGDVYRLDPNDGISLQTGPEIRVAGQVNAFYNTDRHLLIGSDSGLFIYDLQSKRVQLYELGKTGTNPTKFVATFLRADDSKVWIGTGSGLYLFDCARLLVIGKIAYSEDGTSGLSNNKVQALLQLSARQMMVGTANSPNLLDFTEPYFKNISKDKRGEHLLNDNIVFSIFKDGNDLWIGTTDGGLNLIRDGRTYYIKEEANNPKGISGWVRTIVKDERNQRIWVATTRGLGMIDLPTFDPENPKFTIFRHDPENPNSINMDFLKEIALDNEGNVWGATFGQGVFRLQMSGQNKFQIVRYKNEKNNPNSLRNDFVQCIKIDRENRVWIGTLGGLTKLHFINGKSTKPVFTNYYKTSDQQKSLSHNSVYDILMDAQDRIWVATQHGLNLFLGNNEFESWTEQTQFPNAIVYSIQDDLAENLWLGTNDGIVKFDITDRSFTHYGVEDGIQSNEFNTHAKFRDTVGNIYLGGIGGITYFHPDDLEKIDHPNPIYFSQLRVKDQIINTKSSSDNLLKQSLMKTSKLELRHDQFPFYLQFSSIDFRMHKKVEYAYKLLPTDEDWNMLADLEIQFPNLPAGSYTLLVNGFSRGKEWNQPPLEMNLRILPPWWASWWIYIIYFCLASVLSYWFYRFQISKKLAVAEGKRFKEINDLKNSLYTNITHEFRTPLTVILGMADSLESTIENKHLLDAEKSLEMIRRNGKNLLHLVNEMLDLAKSESGNMELQQIQANVVPFVKYLCESFSPLARESQIDLMVYTEIDELVMDFDDYKLSAVFLNLLSNAIKFTSAGGEIVVHLNRITKNRMNFFFVKVKDNGLGISEEALPHIYNRFYQVDNLLSDRKNKGTGIGLALTKEFIELMGGTIEVKSILGKGSEFTVQIPVTINAPEVNADQICQELLIASPIPIGESMQQFTDVTSELPLALIIEDNNDVAHYLRTSMKGKYQTLHAKDGVVGIEMAYEKVPDVIICDVMMPGKDGFEVCATLKSDERTDHIPIIMLTAKATLKDRIAGLAHGADAYLTKPFEKVELFTRLDQLVLIRKKILNKFENEGFGQFLNRRAESPEAKFLKKVVKIIHEELGNHSFGARHLAHKLHLSESQIYRKLKAITGKSTAVFVRSVRLQKAKELIPTTDKTISEIAYEVGFNDPSWFSSAFKEEFGFAPSAMPN